jgi:hypothetical protein
MEKYFFFGRGISSTAKIEVDIRKICHSDKFYEIVRYQWKLGNFRTGRIYIIFSKLLLYTVLNLNMGSDRCKSISSGYSPQNTRN